MKTARTYRRSERGFIALTSVLIVSAILMALMFTTGASSFYARFDALNSEYKRASVGLSESCANAALLKVAQDYEYLPAPGGDTVNVDTDTCKIVAVSYSDRVLDANGVEIRKTMSATTSAQYPAQNGSWSTHHITATIRNPSYVPVTPPTCSFVANTNTIHSGQSVTLTWAMAGNATAFHIERNIGGTIVDLNPGDPVIAGPLTDTPADSATYTATITGPGGTTQCASPQAVTVLPALGECADTLMMLAASMSTPDRTDEGIAAKALLDIYKLATPLPYAGVGSYGGLDGSAAAVPDGTAAFSFKSGWLTTSYGSGAPASGLYATVNEIVDTINASGGTNISAAITAADAEFTRINHPTKAKVLILVSPSGNHQSDVQAAFTAAANAKAAGIQIFTINFGVGSANDDWATIATASTNDVLNGHDEAAAQIENTDGDYFFISPTAEAMDDIFITIAQLVCPGTIPPPPPAVPPPPPPPPVVGEPVSIGSWDEIITVSP